MKNLFDELSTKSNRGIIKDSSGSHIALLSSKIVLIEDDIYYHTGIVKNGVNQIKKLDKGEKVTITFEGE
jgi:hypothetical protein